MDMDPSKNGNGPGGSNDVEESIPEETPLGSPNESPFEELSVPAVPLTPTTKPEPKHDTSFLSEVMSEISSSIAGRQEKFDLSIVTHQTTLGDPKRFGERDFQSHRREDFPQTHHPLRPILTRPMKKKGGIPTKPEQEPLTPAENGSQSHGQTPVGTAITPILGYPILAGILQDDWAPFRAPAAPEKELVADKPKPLIRLNEFDDLIEHQHSKKVQFEVGGSPFNVDSEEGTEKKKFYKSPKVEDPTTRLRSGDEVKDGSNVPLLHESTELPELDKDDLSSHRFSNTKSYRRHKFGAKDSAKSIGSDFNKYDHQPHEIFVELDILSGSGDEREWKEYARWIKYEEDVEEGADRWGKPHLATLSFHSLINLRRLLQTGVVLLDLEERDLPGVAYRVVEQMGQYELIFNEEKATVLRSLLLKHKHVAGKGVWSALRRNQGSHSSLQLLNEDTRGRAIHSDNNTEPSLFDKDKTPVSKLVHQNSVPAHLWSGRPSTAESRRRNSTGLASPTHVTVDLSKLGPGMSEDDLKWLTSKDATLLRQIPTNAEASIVLVGRDDSLHGPTIAFVRLAESVYMPNITEVPIPVRFVFILLGPSNCDLDYKEIGRSISTLMCNVHFQQIAYQAYDRKQLLEGIHEFLDESIVISPGEWDDDVFPYQDLREKSKMIRSRKPLRMKAGKPDQADGEKPPPEEFPSRNPFKRTKRPFGGLILDVKSRYPCYYSDIKDGLNIQCLATIVFLYFACVAGTIALGGIMENKTDRYIGVTESLLGSAVGGAVFALFSCQPLVIVGVSGPTLVFEESLFKFCIGQDIDHNSILAIRVWIGIWLTVIGLIVVGLEGSAMVRFFTRFTTEVFSVLIAMVFIVESVNNVVEIYRKHPIMESYNVTTKCELLDGGCPNVALFSTMLMIGTFAIAWYFRGFKTGTYLNKGGRKILGNFAVLIAIVVMSLISYLVRHPETSRLVIPSALDGLKNTVEERSWLINPLGVDLVWIGLSIVPALLLYILVFMECSIAELVVGKKEYKLRKGCGFHSDVMVLCLINTLMGFLGACWISSAMVRSMTHSAALLVYSTNNPPGEKPVVIGLKEQRVTGFVVSILMGFSVLMKDALGLIPMAVLFGIFLFMGVSSLAGIQFIERLKLLLKQVENHPQVPYVRRVRTWKMNVFTGIQVLAVGVLWAVKSTPAGLALPLAIILLVPFRYFILPLWFKRTELAALDAKGAEPDPKALDDKPGHQYNFGSRQNNTNGTYIKVEDHNGSFRQADLIDENGTNKYKNLRSI